MSDKSIFDEQIEGSKGAHSRNNPSQSDIANWNKVMKEVKRDLIRFIPPVARRRKLTKISDGSDCSTSCEYGRSVDHQIPTISFSRKCMDGIYRSVTELCPRVSTSHSTERTARKPRVNREEKSYNPKKLVYPSVKKLKNWMTTSEGKQYQENKELRRILFDHINKNMRHMNLKVSQEIEAPYISNLGNTSNQVKLPKIQKLETDYKRIRVTHKKTGIMRRNKLLLEHIMHERIRSKEVNQPSLQNYQTTLLHG
jgi:hypothetical protein